MLGDVLRAVIVTLTQATCDVLGEAAGMLPHAQPLLACLKSTIVHRTPSGQNSSAYGVSHSTVVRGIIHAILSLGFPGSLRASVAGIATTGHPDQKPCEPNGHGSPQWPQASSSLPSQMRESRRAWP